MTEPLTMHPAVSDAAVASLRARRAEAEAEGCGLTDYGTVYAVLDGCDTLTGLVSLVQRMLDHHYPADVFKGGSLDSGAQFIFKLREALSCVHADPGATVDASL